MWDADGVSICFKSGYVIIWYWWWDAVYALCGSTSCTICWWWGADVVYTCSMWQYKWYYILKMGWWWCVCIYFRSVRVIIWWWLWDADGVCICFKSVQVIIYDDGRMLMVCMQNNIWVNLWYVEEISSQPLKRDQKYVRSSRMSAIQRLQFDKQPIWNDLLHA